MVACAGGSNGFSPSTLTAPVSPGGNATGAYGVLYRFLGSPDGANPGASLINVRGALYGTTLSGGDSFGNGTVFKITRSGVARLSVLYRFTGSPDGAEPAASLIDVHGTLYGTTASGGASGLGTIFQVTTSGTESTLHSFKGGEDGAEPVASLIDVKGTLYGTTYLGGEFGLGTIFKITTSGRESILHSFGSRTDGANPGASLIDVRGTLYGTTYEGGASGAGTAFKITTSGTESTLYRFKGGKDGAGPGASLIDVHGTLYGTTTYGGTGSCSSGERGCGTVFMMTTKGKESVLYSFAGGSDGANPYGGLTNVGGTLYGTTYEGGGSGCSSGCGTIFQITTSGTERPLYGFKGGTDGFGPLAGLTNVHGILYGTTFAGGAFGCYSSGCGTLFKVSP